MTKKQRALAIIEIHWKRLQVVQGKQTDTVRYFSPHTEQLQQLLPGFWIREQTHRFQIPFPGELMTKKQRALAIIERLKKAYPQAECSLDYDQAWKLLVSVRLAAQCTDALDPVHQAHAVHQPDTVGVGDCGLGNSKARDISACMKMLRDEYGGKVPDDFNKLLALPGVGRKSANLIMGAPLLKGCPSSARTV